MDLEEWELLPREGFIDLEEYDRKHEVRTLKSNRRIVFNKDYFLCPSPTSDQKLLQPPLPPGRTQIREVPVWLEPPKVMANEARDESKMEPEVIKMPIDVTTEPSSKIRYLDQEVVSQVSFKKMRENEFADMKLGSPKATSPRANALPQLETDSIGFDDRNDTLIQKILSSPRKNPDQGNLESRDSVNDGGLNLWKWSLNGIGAIFSFGLAATSFCIIILNSQKQQEQKLQRLRFQIYTDEKKIKEVVRHATKLNQAISAGRGIPVTRAHISYGGYYNGD